MPSVFMLLLVLTFSPVGLFGWHIVLVRVLSLFRIRLSAQASAVVAIVSANVPVLYLAWHFALRFWTRDIFSLMSGLIYVLAVYYALSFVYFQILNISETSLHMHIMLRILLADTLSVSFLKEQYNTERMVQVRLERLLALGQLRCDNNCYYLGNRFLLYGSKVFDIWKILLGFPLNFPSSERGPEEKLQSEE